MTDIHFQGDPRMILNEEGSSIEYVDGQPIMDRGLENLAIISLFTERGWSGNALFKDVDEQYGSDFMEAHRQPITLSALNDIRDAAEKALGNPIFGDVTAITTNPTLNRIQTVITIKPPGTDVQTLLIERNGLNWVAQILDPAHGRISN